MKVKFTFEIRIVHKNSLAVMGHHRDAFFLTKISIPLQVFFFFFFLLFNHFAFTEICIELKLQRETSGSN